jgi:SAM-dependent methyltransferase
MVRVATRLAHGRGRWLDVGCGTGELIETAEREGWVVTGIEPSRTAAGIARARLQSGEVFEGTIDVLPPKLDAFDLVTMTDVLRCISDPRDVAQQLVSRVRPGGWLMIREADARKRRRARAAVEPRGNRRVFDYAQEFTPDSLRALMTNSGLVDIRCVPSPMFTDTSSPPRRFAANAFYDAAGIANSLSGHRAVLTPNFLALGRRPPTAAG